MRADTDAERLATIFERAPGLAARLEPSAGDTPQDIAAKARDAVQSMTEPERIAVLNAHPRIGADPATLSAASRREQGDTSDAATLRELAELNAAYERTFGFRFVVFVAGRPKSHIAQILRARLRNSREVELQKGIDEFLAISLDRLTARRRSPSGP